MNEDKYFNRRLPLINKLLHSYRAIELNEECNDLSKLTNINKCKSCGGECCCNYPCSFDPDDFLRIKSDRYMEIIFNTGLVTISKEFF